MGESCKSRYKPHNPQKYRGNPTNIICRSSWERTFCKYCDLNENVINWASEEFSIRYISSIDYKTHRYFPDYLIEVNEGGKTKKYIIEVKPKKQTKPPIKKSRVTKTYLYEMKTYAVNQAKWKAAQEFCKDNGMQFKIVTEEELYGTRGISRRSKK